MSSQKKISPKIAPTSQAKNEKSIISAIKHLKNLGGSSFAEIKKYLTLTKPETDVFDPKILKLHLKKAVDREKLTLTDGKYQVRETRRRRSRSKSKSGGRRRSRSRKRTGGKRRSRSRKRSGGRRKRGRRSGSRKRRSKSRSGSRRRRRSKKVHHDEAEH